MTSPTIPDLTRDDLAAWLRSTEAKLGPVKRALAQRERSIGRLSGRKRHIVAAGLKVDRALVEGTEGTLALVRAELGMGPVPTECFRTDGHGRRCERIFGHDGLHEIRPNGGVTHRWE